jgi:hypothetical protein
MATTGHVSVLVRNLGAGAEMSSRLPPVRVCCRRRGFRTQGEGKPERGRRAGLGRCRRSPPALRSRQEPNVGASRLLDLIVNLEEGVAPPNTS